MQRHSALTYGLTTLAVALLIIATGTYRELHPQKGHPRSYDEIEASGTLRAVTEYNAISYHVAGDTLQGFDYELLHAFARSKGWKLEITPEMSFDKRLEGIRHGDYDLLATGTLVTSTSKDSLLFTHTLLYGKQVLVQRKPVTVKSQLDLAHRTLHVTENSPARLRLHHLMEEMADTIYVEEVKDYGPEQLIAMVAGGDIDYAVCDESLVKATLTYFPEVDATMDIGFTQLYAWGTAKESEALRDTLNAWLDSYMKTPAYRKLYDKYFNRKTNP